MLSPDYQKILKMPNKLIRILNEVNNRRNQLHFSASLHQQYSRQIIDDYRYLANYFNRNYLNIFNNYASKENFGYNLDAVPV